ncbi:MAG: hypothetical protein WA602_20685, partial [Silvibacterium sp.]
SSLNLSAWELGRRTKWSNSYIKSSDFERLPSVIEPSYHRKWDGRHQSFPVLINCERTHLIQFPS